MTRMSRDVETQRRHPNDEEFGEIKSVCMGHFQAKAWECPFCFWVSGLTRTMYDMPQPAEKIL